MTDFIPRLALVTGATGFVGRHLAHRLLETGWSVRLLVRDRDKLAPTLADRAAVTVGDLADEAALAAAVRDVDVVFHCAANVKTWDSLGHYLAANVTGVAHLLAATKASAPRLTRFVHLSTVDVYGFPVNPCTEESPTTGRGFGYGTSKLLGEAKVIAAGRRHGLPYTILRPANIIGPGSQFIDRIGTELCTGLMMTIDGGRANAGLVDIDHLIDYMLWAAEDPVAIGQCYNVRDAYDVSWADFLSGFKTRIDGQGRIIDLPFYVAESMAIGLEAIHAACWLRREPMIHRLLVRMFGRTCGHSAAKIQRSCQIDNHIPYEQILDRSAAWFLARKRNTKPDA